jgi:hypothetical protein
MISGTGKGTSGDFSVIHHGSVMTFKVDDIAMGTIRRDLQTGMPSGNGAVIDRQVALGRFGFPSN